jgi:hypothetical protein
MHTPSEECDISGSKLQRKNGLNKEKSCNYEPFTHTLAFCVKNGKQKCTPPQKDVQKRRELTIDS